MNKKPVILCIMDGYGLRDNHPVGNAIFEAKKPNLDRIFSKYAFTRINASGEYVGLPDGQMGNSEVGHMNIGAGRIVYQSLTLINKAIKEKTFFDNAKYKEAIELIKFKKLPEAKVLSIYHKGSYENIGEAYAFLMKYAEQNGYKAAGLTRECYIDGIWNKESEEDWLTEIQLPIE